MRLWRLSIVEKMHCGTPVLWRICDIEVTADCIYMRQDHYANSIEEIDIDKNEDPERPLNKKEFKAYRGITGKLVWLNEATRPDLSFDSLSLAYQNKDAKIKHIIEANKIVRKAKASESFTKFSHIGKFEELKIVLWRIFTIKKCVYIVPMCLVIMGD